MRWSTLEKHGSEFDALHARPPCPAFALGNNETHPDLLTPTIDAPCGWKIPYVVKNVITVPMPCTIKLFGSSNGLKVRRHRKFHSNVLIPILPCRHKNQGRLVGAYGKPDGLAFQRSEYCK